VNNRTLFQAHRRVRQLLGKICLKTEVMGLLEQGFRDQVFGQHCKSSKAVKGGAAFAKITSITSTKMF